MRSKRARGPKRRRSMCAECSALRELAGVQSCTSVRICRTFDTNLRELLPGLTYEQYRVADGVIQDSHERTKQWVRKRFDAIDDPTPERFVELLCEIHRRIFQTALGPAAGATRASPVEVDHDEHMFGGVEPSKIVPRLHDLWRSNGGILEAPQEHEPFSWWAARFFQSFFRTHPFRDGNGRTARLYVEIAALRRGFLVNWAQDTRKYSMALRYAHKHLGVTTNEPRNEVRASHAPFVPLARWVRSCVLDRAPEFLDEEPWEKSTE